MDEPHLDVLMPRAAEKFAYAPYTDRSKRTACLVAVWSSLTRQHGGGMAARILSSATDVEPMLNVFKPLIAAAGKPRLAELKRSSRAAACPRLETHSTVQVANSRLPKQVDPASSTLGVAQQHVLHECTTLVSLLLRSLVGQHGLSQLVAVQRKCALARFRDVETECAEALSDV